MILCVVQLLVGAMFPGICECLNCITCDSGVASNRFSSKCVTENDIKNHVPNLTATCNNNPTITPLCYFGFYKDENRKQQAIRGCEISGKCTSSCKLPMKDNNMIVRCCKGDNCNTMTATAFVNRPRLQTVVLLTSIAFVLS
ncbi:uncharacterized protein LOC141912945 [Tubulanus polymorphus]|uniref:uncharacterized protein LOC141912945 n=1 Tax=Tubulanus polymorphus TaxID=672921 RepID=UPI003DA36CAA